jgi:hypothetical protein
VAVVNCIIEACHIATLPHCLGIGQPALRSQTRYTVPSWHWELGTGHWALGTEQWAPCSTCDLGVSQSQTKGEPRIGGLLFLWVLRALTADLSQLATTTRRRRYIITITGRFAWQYGVGRWNLHSVWRLAPGVRQCACESTRHQRCGWVEPNRGTVQGGLFGCWYVHDLSSAVGPDVQVHTYIHKPGVRPITLHHRRYAGIQRVILVQYSYLYLLYVQTRTLEEWSSGGSPQ